MSTPVLPHVSIARHGGIEDNDFAILCEHLRAQQVREGRQVSVNALMSTTHEGRERIEMPIWT